MAWGGLGDADVDADVDADNAFAVIVIVQRLRVLRLLRLLRLLRRRNEVKDETRRRWAKNLWVCFDPSSMVSKSGTTTVLVLYL